MIKGLTEHRWFSAALGGVVALAVLVYLFLPRAGIGAGIGADQFLLQLLPAAYVGVQALCLVLIYRTVRIVNFAQVAFGVVGQVLLFHLYTRDLLPYFASLPLGILAGTLMVLVIGVILSTLFFKHPRLTLTVVTIFSTQLIGEAVTSINGAFIQPGETPAPLPIPLPGRFEDSTLFAISGTPIRMAHLIGFLTVAASLLGLWYFFRRSRTGIAIRASAENADRASLLGVNVKLVNVMVWGIVGLLTSVAAIATMPVIPFNPGSTLISFETILPALCAAVLARFESMPLALLYGVTFHLLRIGLFVDTEISDLLDVALVVIVLAGLFLQKQRSYSRLDDSTSWKATREVRPTPVEMLQIPAIARTRRILSVLLALVVVGLPLLVSPATAGDYATIWLFGMVLVSLVVLVGWTGQLSLGHTVFVGAGALLAGNLTSGMGIPFLLALPLGGLAGALLAVVIGLPALRIRGLFLAVATFSVAVVFPVLFLNERYLASWVPDAVQSPRFFGVGFENQRFFYYFTFVIFGIITLAVRTLRKSRAGRLLIAIRDNEQGVQALSVNIVRTRLMAFAITGFIAGIAGGILVHFNRGMDLQTYGADRGIFVFQLIIVGGVSSVVGGFLGSFFFTMGLMFFPGSLPLITGMGGLFLLMAAPGGLAQMVFGMRDAVLRVVAIRRHLVVPSLFADYSPEAWEKRLTPLSPASPTQGLGALPADQRYALPSRLYGKKVS